MRRGLKDGPGPSACPTEDVLTERALMLSDVDDDPSLINPGNVTGFSSSSRGQRAF